MKAVPSKDPELLLLISMHLILGKSTDTPMCILTCNSIPKRSKYLITRCSEMKPLQTEPQEETLRQKSSPFQAASHSLTMQKAIEHTWGLAACSMIFSSKVWSCSLTESLESPSLSSKLGSTEERKREHPNPSKENSQWHSPSALSPAGWRDQPSHPSAEPETNKSLPSALLERKPLLYTAATADAKRTMVTSPLRTHTQSPYLCQFGPWSDLASGILMQKLCQSPGEPPASTGQMVL